MTILIFIIEWVVAFFIIWGLNSGLNNLFTKRINPLMASIVTFLIIGFIGFFISPYVLSFPYPAIIYLPIALFFLVLTLYKILKPKP